MVQQQQVFFLGISRIGPDGRAIILANYSYNTDTDLNGVRKIVEQPNLAPGKHYTFQTGDVSWHLIQDSNSIIYVVISAQYYPPRVANACLKDLSNQFIDKVGPMEAVRGKENAFNRTCSALLHALSQKYNNPADFDKLASVTQKIENVKVVMKENVAQALENCVKMERIEEAAADLEQQAGAFKKSATELRNKMWWKNVKMWLVIGGVFAVILTIIIAVSVNQHSQSSSS